MKKIQVVLAALTLLVSSSTFAAQKEFNIDEMTRQLESELKLKREEYNKLKPELEKALEGKKKELEQSIDESISKGIVELDRMSRELDAASKEAQKKLEQALSSDQVKDLQAFLESWDKEAIEAAYENLLAELTKLLEMSKEQIAELAPVIKETLKKQAELLRKFAADAGGKFEQFREEWEALSKELRQKLDKTLDSKQLEKMDKRMDDIKEDLNKSVFQKKV